MMKPDLETRIANLEATVAELVEAVNNIATLPDIVHAFEDRDLYEAEIDRLAKDEEYRAAMKREEEERG